jgi:hypothetical protein
MPGIFPDSFEVRVYSFSDGRTLVEAIELISPGNKDRREERRAFATKCASYLHPVDFEASYQEACWHRRLA